MFCEKCGTKLNDSAMFCSNCGARIVITPAPVAAPVAPAPVAAPAEAPVAPAPVAAPVEAPVTPAPVAAPVEAPVTPAPVAAPVEAPVTPAPVAAPVAPVQPVNYAYQTGYAPAPQPPKKKGISPLAIVLIILSILIVGVGAFVAVDYLANDGEIIESIFGSDDKDDEDENADESEGEGENEPSGGENAPVVGDYTKGYLAGYSSEPFVAAFERAWSNYPDAYYDSYGETMQTAVAWKTGWQGPNTPATGIGQDQIAFTCGRSEIYPNGNTSYVYTYLIYTPSTNLITAQGSTSVVTTDGNEQTYTNDGNKALAALQTALENYADYESAGDPVPPQGSTDEPTTEQPSQNENVSIANGYLQNYPSRPFVAAFDEAISNYLAKNPNNTAELTWSLGWSGTSAPDDSDLYDSEYAFTCLMKETVYGESADSYIYLIYDADQNLITVKSYIQVQYISGEDKTIELDSAQGLSTLNNILNQYL